MTESTPGRYLPREEPGSSEGLVFPSHAWFTFFTPPYGYYLLQGGQWWVVQITSTTSRRARVR